MPTHMLSISVNSLWAWQYVYHFSNTIITYYILPNHDQVLCYQMASLGHNGLMAANTYHYSKTVMLICDIMTVPHYIHLKNYKIHIYVIVILILKLVK